MRVCEGVDSAHRDLVVHRDLKPANILVTRDGTPKLLDFGIAKLLDPDAQIDAATITNLQAMTPDYASPEQVRGEPVSTSADVYALGLILYELLTGRKAQKIVDLTPAAIARMVCQTEPSAPASLKPQLAGDLDNIIRMAIRKEPDRRYASAGVLAHDIQRHLEGRPVIARRDTFAYRLAKFLRRNRIPVAVVVLIAASLSGGLALEYWLGAFAPLPHVLQVVQLTQTGRVEIVGGVVTDGSRVYFTERSGGNWSLAEVSVKGGTPAPLPVTPTISQPDILDISPDRSSLLVAGQPGEGGDRPLWIVPSAGGPARRIGDVLGHAGAWSPDGRHIVFARGPSLFRMNIDGTNRRKLLDTPGKLADWIRWSPTGGADVLRLHIVANDVVDRALWEMAPDGTGLHRLTLGQTHGAGASNGNSNGAWTQSGRYYLFRSVRGTVASLWAVRENRHWLPLFDQHPVQIYSTPLDFESLAPSPDGKRVFITAGYERRELVRYDAGRGQFLPYLSGVAARWVSFSKDGRWVAYTTVADGALWRSRSDGSERMQLTPPSVTVGIPRWSPDGSRIAFFGRISGKAGTVYIIPSAGGVPEEVAPGLGEPSWSADGNSLLLAWLPRAGGPPPGLYVMDLKTHRTTRVPGSEGTLRAVWSPDSRYIAGNRAGSEIVLFDFHTRRWTHLASGSGLGVPMWSRDSRHLYYQEVMGGVHQPIFRILVGSGRIERVVDARQIPQSNVAAYLMCGLAPADAPVATLIRSNSDIYALDVDLP
jgi:Tol biopolymer transport system component